MQAQAQAKAKAETDASAFVASEAARSQRAAGRHRARYVSARAMRTGVAARGWRKVRDAGVTAMSRGQGPAARCAPGLGEGPGATSARRWAAAGCRVQGVRLADVIKTFGAGAHSETALLEQVALAMAVTTSLPELMWPNTE